MENNHETLDITLTFEREDRALHFTFADTEVDITSIDEETGEKKLVGKVTAIMGGGFKFRYTPEEGTTEQYCIYPRALWNAFCDARGIPDQKIPEPEPEEEG